MASLTWMIYGANGYTGSRIAQKATKLGYTPILAGRKQHLLHQLSQKIGCSYRVFDLKDHNTVQKMIHDVGVLLNCAGPFIYTTPTLLTACLRSGTHYLDITGEIAVIEYCARYHQEALSKNILICPGVGFDVTPTDHLAKALHDQLPDAQHLRLGFSSTSPVSPGTAKTVLLGFKEPPQVRKKGIIQPLGANDIKRFIDFGNGLTESMAVSWGDVSSAWYSTKIPNISVFIPIPKGLESKIMWLQRLRPLLQRSIVQKIAGYWVDFKVQGPLDVELTQKQTRVWGEVRSANNVCLSASFNVPNGYQLTVEVACTYCEWLLAQETLGSGFKTPTQAFPAALFWSIPGVGSLQWQGLEHNRHYSL